MQRRHVAIIAAAAMVVSAGFIGTQVVSGQSASDETVFVPVTPCRLVDTRPGTATVGPVATAIGEGQDVTFTAWGTGDADSPCDIPNSATAIATNATAVGPSEATFLTLYPADVDNPGTSNLNVIAGQAPTPNSANIPLSSTGQFNVFNRSGDVNVIIDVNGYYQPSSAVGSPGSQGPAGPAGSTGPQGPAGTTGSADTGHSIATVDAEGSVGEFSSVAIGTNGNPIISYYDNTNDELRVAACTTPNCTVATSIPLDGSVDVGRYTSIAIGNDGNPVISYHDVTNTSLRVAACTTPTCTTRTVTTLDDTSDVGQHTSIAIGNDGNPVISYHDNSTEDLKVATCFNPACTNAFLITLDSTDDVGEYTSIAIGADGNPIISYRDDTNADLRVAACTNPTCTAAPTVTNFNVAGNVSADTSITIGADGNPIISYRVFSTLRVSACTNPTCTASTTSTLDGNGNVGSESSITIGNDGNPIISYRDLTNFDLKVAACIDPTCTGTPTLTTLDARGNIGRFTSIVIGTDGNPVISFLDDTNADLKVAVCGNPTCTGYTGRSR